MSRFSILHIRWFGVTALILLVGCTTLSVDPDLPQLYGLKWARIPAGEFRMGSDYASKVACKEGVPPAQQGIASPSQHVSEAKINETSQNA